MYQGLKCHIQVMAAVLYVVAWFATLTAINTLVLLLLQQWLKESGSPRISASLCRFGSKVSD